MGVCGALEVGSGGHSLRGSDLCGGNTGEHLPPHIKQVLAFTLGAPVDRNSTVPDVIGQNECAGVVVTATAPGQA